jgi:hemerythrin
VRALYQWSDEFLSGFKVIDEQHKQYIFLFNRFLTILENGSKKDELKKIVMQAIALAKDHFETEEALFEKYNYPHTEEHKKAHEEFTQKTREIGQKLEQKVLTIDFSLLDFLYDWHQNHLKVEDSKYTKYFREIGVTEY